MLSQLSEQLTPHNQYKMTAILGELCDDISVAEYRLDIIDDLLADSALTTTLRKVVDKMLVNDRTNIYKLTTPDSFTVLDTALTAFESYCECMEILHKLYEENHPVSDPPVLKSCLISLRGITTASIIRS